MAGLRPPGLLAEWPEVPGLLGAVKRSVDSDPAPGRAQQCVDRVGSGAGAAPVGGTAGQRVATPGIAGAKGAGLRCGLRKGTMVARCRAGAAAGSRRCSPPVTVPEGERNEQ